MKTIARIGLKKFVLAASALALFAGAFSASATDNGCHHCYYYFHTCAVSGEDWWTCYAQLETCLYIYGCVVP